MPTIFRCSALVALILSLGSSLSASTALVHAQRTKDAFNLGLQVGQPAGATGKVYRSPRTAYQGLFTTDADDFFTLHVYRLRERPLPDSLVYLYVGPGLLAGARSLNTTPEPEVGLSVQGGLNFYVERFEIFLQLTPALRFSPNVSPSLGGSVGLRYNLHRPDP